MRFRTKKVTPNQVRFSYYVSFLRWLGLKMYNRAERITDRAFN